jgi:competence protein ComEA
MLNQNPKGGTEMVHKTVPLKTVLMLVAVLSLLASPAAFASSGGKIDLNTATSVQLQELPGVGEKTADAIVKYRKDNGAFHSVDDLLNVKGIGEKKLEKIRSHVKVGKSKTK